jgi:hypothetical protein
MRSIIYDIFSAIALKLEQVGHFLEKSVSQKHFFKCFAARQKWPISARRAVVEKSVSQKHF